MHALGQVASFTTKARHRPETFLRALNRWLPADIVVRQALEVPPDFDPRRQAASRTYRYLVYNGRTRSPLLARLVWQVLEPLDTEALAEAAAVLVGQHDFAAFTGRTASSTVRTVQRAQVRHRGCLVTLEMEADAFLHHQVRRTAGALIRVGQGRLSVGDFEELLRRAEPFSAGPTAPPWGLYLVRVRYAGLEFAGEAHPPLAEGPKGQEQWL